jgi:anaerobic magnesium-protoporphyrin IX monomethyl ester cyclase
LADILLTHSYHLYYDRKQARKMQPYPPLGTLYAAALLRQQGYSVAVFDSTLEDPERNFHEVLRRHRPKVVAIYEDNFNFLSKMCLSRMREVAFGMISTAQQFGCMVLVNGSDASDHVSEYLKLGADFVMLGEAEWTLVELVGSLLGRRQRPVEEIPGLAFYNKVSGTLVQTTRHPLMRDLDSLPLPARDLVDIEQYRRAWKSAHGFFSLNLTASRGCPFRCNWCAKPIYGDEFHLRSAKSVAEEMALLKNLYGLDHLWFADDIFGLKTQWVAELAEMTRRLDASIPFKIQSRVDLMKEETTRALRQAGCAEVWMGVESGSQKILNAMDKGIRVEQVAQSRENLRSAGIRACFFIQFGYAGESWEDIQQTIRLIRKTQPDDIGISVSYPLPGTRFYERVSAQLGSKTNWIDSEDISMMFRGVYTTEFYRALHDALHAEVAGWSLRRAWPFPVILSEGTQTAGEVGNPDDLWAKIEVMEKTCRNAHPTLLPVLECSKLCSA